MPKPDLDKFWTDPAFAEDKKFLTGAMEKFLTEKAEEARKKKEAEELANPPSIFDQLFGGK
jgi:hypothetical protein